MGFYCRAIISTSTIRTITVNILDRRGSTIKYIQGRLRVIVSGAENYCGELCAVEVVCGDLLDRERLRFI